MKNNVCYLIILLLLLFLIWYVRVLFFLVESKSEKTLQKWIDFLPKQKLDVLWNLRHKYQNKVIKSKSLIKKNHYLEIIGLIDKEIELKK